MTKNRSWSDEELIAAVAASTSFRKVLIVLGLIPAGGNYVQIQARIYALELDTSHFLGNGWNKGKTYHTNTRAKLEDLLTANSNTQSYKLKKRLFEVGLKEEKCELFGWAAVSEDGRIPVELDHINGEHSDNRLENLRILCPNCHSLQSTHRGRNKKVRLVKLKTRQNYARVV